MADEDYEEGSCPGHVEHDYAVLDERDGHRTLTCTRCGAEAFESDDEDEDEDER